MQNTNFNNSLYDICYDYSILVIKSEVVLKSKILGCDEQNNVVDELSKNKKENVSKVVDEEIQPTETLSSSVDKIRNTEEVEGEFTEEQKLFVSHEIEDTSTYKSQNAEDIHFSGDGNKSMFASNNKNKTPARCSNEDYSLNEELNKTTSQTDNQEAFVVVEDDKNECFCENIDNNLDKSQSSNSLEKCVENDLSDAATISVPNQPQSTLVVEDEFELSEEETRNKTEDDDLNTSENIIDGNTNKDDDIISNEDPDAVLVLKEVVDSISEKGTEHLSNKFKNEIESSSKVFLIENDDYNTMSPKQTNPKIFEENSNIFTGKLEVSSEENIEIKDSKADVLQLELKSTHEEESKEQPVLIEDSSEKECLEKCPTKTSDTDLFNDKIKNKPSKVDEKLLKICGSTSKTLDVEIKTESTPSENVEVPSECTNDLVTECSRTSSEANLNSIEKVSHFERENPISQSDSVIKG